MKPPFNVVKGRALDRYTTLLSREVIGALKDDDLRAHFNRTGHVEFKMDLEEVLQDLEWVRDVFVSLGVGERAYVDAKYEFVLDATPEERVESDIIINVLLPQDYPNSVFSELIPELKDALRHELEHSAQPTEMLMRVQEEIPDGNVWKSLESARKYYTSEAEIKAHVAGIYKRAKVLREAGGQSVDNFLVEVWQTGVDNGYVEEELHPLMQRIRELWRYYMMVRYPLAAIDLES